MICFVSAFRHIFQALFNDPQTLPHFFYPHHSPVITIAVLADWNIKVKILIAGIGLLFPEIPVKTTGS